MVEKDNFMKLISLICVGGDLTHLDGPSKRALLAKLTNYLHLNPYSHNFFIFKDSNGRHRIYATKECCSQLRHNMGINTWLSDPIYGPNNTAPVFVTVKANGTNRFGRSADEIGSVTLIGFDKSHWSDRIMFATTKAKRRLTLDLSGLGVLSDVEVDDIFHEKTKISNLESSDYTPDQESITSAQSAVVNVLSSVLTTDKNM
jgi:hypothetical protein